VLSGDVDVVQEGEICCGAERVNLHGRQRSQVLAQPAMVQQGVQPTRLQETLPAAAPPAAMSLHARRRGPSAWAGGPLVKGVSWSSIPASGWGCLAQWAPVKTTTFNLVTAS